MVKYLYAIDDSGKLVCISEASKGTKYICPECNDEMIPVLGKVREPHFRHKNKECSRESYLHKVSKLYYQNLFYNSDKFVVKYYVKTGCNKMDCKIRGNDCETSDYTLRELDLKGLYDTCEIERGDFGYRADVKLSNSKDETTLPLFLEIVFSHRSTIDKLESGIPIIEIDVREQSDLTLPIVESYSPDSQNDGRVRIYNLPRTRQYKKNLNGLLFKRNNSGNLIISPTKPKCCYNNVGVFDKEAILEMQYFEGDNKSSKYKPLYFFICEAKSRGLLNSPYFSGRRYYFVKQALSNFKCLFNMD